MTVYEVLKRDHERVKKLFEQIEETSERALKTRQKLWEEVAEELRIHAELEERHFYPLLENAEETREIILEAHEEHDLATRLLDELDEFPMDDERWMAKFKVFKENVTHHAKEEERELFPAARTVIDRQHAQELAEEIEEARDRMMAGVGGSTAGGRGSGSTSRHSSDDEE